MSKIEIRILIGTAIEAEIKTGVDEAAYFLSKAHSLSEGRFLEHLLIHALLVRLFLKFGKVSRALSELIKFFTAIPETLFLRFKA